MNRLTLALAALLLASLTACNEPAAPAPAAPASPGAGLPPGHPPTSGMPAGTPKGPTAMPAVAPMPTDAAAGGVTGTVAETLNAPGYTYVRLTTATGEVWAAGPTTTVAVGQKVTAVRTNTMRNFESKTLGKTFATIEFAEQLLVDGAGTAAPAAAVAPAPAADPHGAPAAAPAGEVKVERAPGGKTVSEIWAGAGAMKGQKVKLQAKVVKASNGILGKNWWHVQDGTGAAGKDDDLVVTTLATAVVGDVVVLEGTVATDKDLGAGYKYAVIVEDAVLAK